MTSKHYDTDRIEYCDCYINPDFDNYREVVIVETDLQKFFDLSDEEIIKRAKAIIEEWNNYFN